MRRVHKYNPTSFKNVVFNQIIIWINAILDISLEYLLQMIYID
jgi:hypothetical protein